MITIAGEVINGSQVYPVQADVLSQIVEPNDKKQSLLEILTEHVHIIATRNDLASDPPFLHIRGHSEDTNSLFENDFFVPILMDLTSNCVKSGARNIVVHINVQIGLIIVEDDVERASTETTEIINELNHRIERTRINYKKGLSIPADAQTNGGAGIPCTIMTLLNRFEGKGYLEYIPDPTGTRVIAVMQWPVDGVNIENFTEKLGES